MSLDCQTRLLQGYYRQGPGDPAMVEMLHTTVCVGNLGPGWLPIHFVIPVFYCIHKHVIIFCVPAVVYEANNVKKAYKEHSSRIEKWAKEESTAIPNDKNVLQRKQWGR